MKKIILVGDGMGDYPLDALEGKTPLQCAHIPNMRRIAAHALVKMARTVPPGMPPGSDVANLSLMGYDPACNYTGRAPIEAAGMGLELASDDIAFRCNLVTIRNGLMVDYSAGHISDHDASALIETCQNEFTQPGLHFHMGVSYRHLTVWRNGPSDITTQPPHDIADKPIADYLPRENGGDAVCQLQEASADLFRDHPVNLARVAAGKEPATQIWLWGQGRALHLDTYGELYHLQGGVISAVNLIRGLGALAGLKIVKVPGATGFLDTNYQGKVDAALHCLETSDFVYVHIEAPDECGHMGDLKLKMQAIEDFDAKVVGPIWCTMEQRGEPYRLIVCMDHRTPIPLRGHSAEAVPVACLDGPVGKVDDEMPFDESLEEHMEEVSACDWIASLLRA